MRVEEFVGGGAPPPPPSGLAGIGGQLDQVKRLLDQAHVILTHPALRSLGLDLGRLVPGLGGAARAEYVPPPEPVAPAPAAVPAGVSPALIRAVSGLHPRQSLADAWAQLTADAEIGPLIAPYAGQIRELTGLDLEASA